MTNACAECPGPRSQSDRSGVTCAQERNGNRPATGSAACVVPEGAAGRGRDPLSLHESAVRVERHDSRASWICSVTASQAGNRPCGMRLAHC
jgi:hypothetical protein